MFRKILRVLSVVDLKVISFLTVVLTGGLSVVSMWLYLNKLGRLDLFADTLGYKNISAAISFFSLLSVVIVIIVFFMPSILMVAKFLDKNSFFGGAEEVVIKTAPFISFFFLLSVYLSAYLDIEGVLGERGVWLALVSLFVFYLFVYCFKFFNRVYHSDEVDDRKKRKNAMFQLVIVMPFTSSVLALLPMITAAYFIKLLSFSEGESDVFKFIGVAVFFALICLFSYIPGAFYLRSIAHSGKNSLRFILMSFLLSIMLLFPLSFVMSSIPSIIVNMGMKMSGVSSDKIMNYIVDGDEYPVRLFADKQWSLEKIVGSNKYIISGVNIFDLGSIKLICPESITPIYRDSFKFSILNSRGYEDSLSKRLKDKAAECMPLKKNFIFQWSEPKVSQKVKLGNDK